MSQQLLTTPRIDAETAQRLIARAAALQQEHLETISPDQLEALASEVGVSPEFVRRALAEQEASQITLGRDTATVPTQAVSASPTHAPLTRAGILRALAATALLGLILGVIPEVLDNRPNVQMVFLVAGGPLLTFSAGFWLRSRRLGAATGFASVFAMAIVVALVRDLHSEIMPQLMALGSVAALVGAIGAAARRLWDRLR